MINAMIVIFLTGIEPELVSSTSTLGVVVVGRFGGVSS